MWLKRGSLVAVFFILLALISVLDLKDRFSLSFDALLPPSKSKDAGLIYQKINQIQEVILATKNGANSDLGDMLREIETLEGYAAIYPPKKEFEEFLTSYRFYLYDTPNSLPNQTEIREKLSKLKDDLLNGFTLFADQNDPLSLFQKKRTTVYTPSIMGFDNTVLFRLNITPNDYEKYYDKLQDIVKNSDDVYLFSPFFYQVENSRAFKHQIKLVLGLSAVILGFLYLYWLRNPALFIFTVITLLSSTAFSQIVAAMLWSEISVYTLLFGAAVSTVSIDYMFHHYLHNAYGGKKQFLKTVFYGFLTSFAAFLALSLSHFTLISQISLTAACALLFAYISFAFIYPRLGFKEARTRGIGFKSKNTLNSSLICILSIVIIASSVSWTKFNTDIKSLDVENKNLAFKQSLALKSLGAQDKVAILLYADTLSELIEKAEALNSNIGAASLLSVKNYEARYDQFKELDFGRLRKDIESVSLELGFKKGYFGNSYSDKLLFAPPPIYMDEFLSGLKIMSVEGKIYASGFYERQAAEELHDESVLVIDSISLFENELKKAAEELMYIGIFVTIFISLFILYLAKKEFARSFSFVLAPLALCLLMFLFTEATILHIFMLIIVIATSVDYGIYNAKAAGKRTNEAISYSLLSTIAGFGVLALSAIPSLRAVGITALCATFATMALLHFTKAKYEIDT